MATTGATEGGPDEALRGLALSLLEAVDEGTPAGVPARALALAVLSSATPGGSTWLAAVAVLEGGPLRVRRAVMLAGEVLGDADTLSPAVAPTRAS